MKHLFEGLVSEKKYMKLKEGETRFRIVQMPISGWLDWDDKKPHRYKLDEKPSKSFDPEKPAKPFLACYVWDYDKAGLYILELGQNGIIKTLKGFCESDDWGDLTGYDIKIKRTGTGVNTKYSVEPVPPKPMIPKITEALKASPVRLEALYEGKDPWLDLEPSDVDTTTGEVKSMSVDNVIGTPLETLKELLEIDGIDTGRLEGYVNELAAKKGQPVHDVYRAALKMPDKFKQAYLKDLSRKSADLDAAS